MIDIFIPIILLMVAVAIKDKKEPILIQYIKERIFKKNKNFVIVFVGATGSGKSFAGLRLAQMLDPTFDITRCTFKARDFMNQINEMVDSNDKVSGKVIFWDELGVEHNAREFMTISNRVMNYFFQTSRHLNLIVIMTVPLLSFIDSATRKLLHGIAEMQGISTRDKTSSVKIKMLQVNTLTGKEYPKYLRYKRNGKTYVSKRLKFKLPSQDLIDAYEIKKKKFTKQLNKEIMDKLLKVENKDKPKTKPLTQNQEKVLNLLLKNGAEDVAKELSISLSGVYAHKVNIEKKGYSFKPISENNKIIRYVIEEYNPNSSGNPETPPV